MTIADRLGALYRNRFSSSDVAVRQHVWTAVVRGFLQKYVPRDAVVVDLAAGEGLFLRPLLARRRIAYDLNLDEPSLHACGIETAVGPANDLGRRFPETADVVFVSNFLEHLHTRDEVIEVLVACHEALKPGGRILVLQPNIRFAGPAYWDFIDHHIALTEKSVAEALAVAGFDVEEVIPQFLPYTSKSALAQMWRLTSAYVRLPVLWRFFGGQAFLVATKKPAGA